MDYWSKTPVSRLGIFEPRLFDTGTDYPMDGNPRLRFLFAFRGRGQILNRSYFARVPCTVAIAKRCIRMRTNDILAVYRPCLIYIIKMRSLG